MAEGSAGTWMTAVSFLAPLTPIWAGNPDFHDMSPESLRSFVFDGKAFGRDCNDLLALDAESDATPVAL